MRGGPEDPNKIKNKIQEEISVDKGLMPNKEGIIETGIQEEELKNVSEPREEETDSLDEEKKRLKDFKERYPETIDQWFSVFSGFTTELKIWTFSVQHGNVPYTPEYVIFEMKYANGSPDGRIVFGPKLAGLLSKMEGTWSGIGVLNIDAIIMELHKVSEGEIKIPPVVLEEIIESCRRGLKPR